MVVILEEEPRQYATKQPDNANVKAQILPDERVMRMYKIDLSIFIYPIYSSVGRSFFILQQMRLIRLVQAALDYEPHLQSHTEILDLEYIICREL